jgi:kumamolisin
VQKSPLQGSDRKPLDGARPIGPADPHERGEVTLLLRHNALGALQDRVQRLTRGDYSLMPLTREDFALTHGATPGDIEAVTAFAAAHNLAVVSADAGRRTVVLSGSVGDLSAAFDVTLQTYEHDKGHYRGREGAVQLPDNLKDIVQAVMGLDNRPAATPHFRRPANVVSARNLNPPTKFCYAPISVARLYSFPPGNGAGQTIGIIELGGGTRAADLAAYFAGFGLQPPKLTTVSVDHALNQATGNIDSFDGEVMLDIEVAGAVAPGANLVAYFAPNTDAGFLDAITTAIHDTTNRPDIISISWGGPESEWTLQSLTAYDEAFQVAAALGITVCVASGDHGSTDGMTDGANHVDFPASSPHVLACGGTNLQARSGMILSETVWNGGAQGGASGGGISGFFTAPAWQTGLAATLTAGGTIPLTKRGVPDVCGDADPATGYQVRVDGTNTVIGGTSAVAPLWAALIARINAARKELGSVGFINPLLYDHPDALHHITEGNNGAYAAAAGWDACTGLGSPKGNALATLLTKRRTTTSFNNKGTEMTDETKSQPLEPNILLISGNDTPAEPAASPSAPVAEPNILLISGNAEPAAPAAPVASPDILLISGNDEPAAPEASPVQKVKA